MIHRLSRKAENKTRFSGEAEPGDRHDSKMRPWGFLICWLGIASFGTAEEESGAQRLENAQRGIAEASWPRKPDQRLSSLSGKIKNLSEISPRIFGSDREFRTHPWEEGQKEASPTSSSAWDGSRSKGWEEARWNQAGEWTRRESQNAKFQPLDNSETARILSYRELGRESAPEWSSRASPLAGGSGGGLRRYEGRLTRVREQVVREEKNVRDLGPGRQEKFSPEEVEKMLSEPVGELRGTVTGQSGGASPP